MPRARPAALIKRSIRKKPKPDIRFRPHKSFGKITQVGVCAYMFDMFTLNEEQPKNRKMPNAEMERMLKLEFAHREKLVAGLDDPNNCNCINLMRHKYNKGILVSRLRPVYLSVRYNHKGQAVDSRTGEFPLTKGQYLALLQKYDLDFEAHGNPETFARLPE